MQVPNQKQIRQSNISDNEGEIVSSFGLDLTSNPGRIRVAPRLLQVSSTDSNSSITAPATNFAYYGDGTGNKIWTMAGNALQYNNIYPNTSFTTDSVSLPYPVDSTVTDIIDFAGNLVISTNTGGVGTIQYRAVGSSTYNQAATIFSSTNNFFFIYAQRLYFLASSTTINSMTSSYVVATSGSFTTGISEDTQITCVLVGKNKIWIGTINTYTKKGGIHLWDGQATQILARYPLATQGVISGVLKDDVPYFIDVEGKLLGFNGSSFVEIDRLPFERRIGTGAVNSTNTRFIHPRGMEVVDGHIQMLINGVLSDANGTLLSRCPSGIYELDDNNKIYHKYAISYTPVGTNIISDYGQERLVNVGALKQIKTVNPNTNANGTLLTSASFYKPDGTTTTAIFTEDTNDTVQKYGHFTTAWFDAAGIDENLQKIYVKVAKLLNSTDRVDVKFRLDKKDSIELAVNWLSPNTFTTTSDVTSYKNYEAEITQGGGSGYCSKITNVVYSAGVSTVTLKDNANITGAGSIGKVRFQYWIEAGASLQNTNRNYIEYAVGKTFTSAQIKVCMTFTGKNELYSVLTTDKSHKQ